MGQQLFNRVVTGRQFAFGQMRVQITMARSTGLNHAMQHRMIKVFLALIDLMPRPWDQMMPGYTADRSATEFTGVFATRHNSFRPVFKIAGLIWIVFSPQPQTLSPGFLSLRWLKNCAAVERLPGCQLILGEIEPHIVALSDVEGP